MRDAVLLAGFDWGIALRGILSVFVGVVVLCGSVWLIVATNTGARLAMLLSLAGFFGWMSIMTLFWTIQPPGIGPKGPDPKWNAVEVFVHDPSSGPAQTELLNLLPGPDELPAAAEIIDAHPELAAEFTSTPENLSLSDLAGVAPDLVPGAQPETRDELNGWALLSTGEAGEAQAVADEALVEAGIFGDATEYKKLNAFKIGGRVMKTEECPNPQQDEEKDLLCEAWFRVRETFRLKHSPQFAVVQVQQVVMQEPAPGEAPPAPTVDPNEPVISVVLLRDEGATRMKPALWFVISISMFAVFSLILHNRDKTLQRNLRDAAQGS